MGKKALGRREAQLVEAQTRLMADDWFRKALGDITKHARDRQSRAAGSVEALEFLPIGAYFAVTYKRHARYTPREDWQRTWASHAGMSWKGLTDFPGRVRRMAAEVKTVSQHASFDPERVISVKTPSADFAKRQFELLPATMVRYADWLELQIKKSSTLLQSFYLRIPRKNSPFIPYLSEQVKLITGRYLDEEVADLLNAADFVLNNTTEPRFCPQLLLDLRSRQKRKLPKT